MALSLLLQRKTKTFYNMSLIKNYPLQYCETNRNVLVFKQRKLFFSLPYVIAYKT